MLPALEQLFARVDLLKSEIRASHDQLQVLELLWGDSLNDPSNPDTAEAATLSSGLEARVLEIQHLIRTGILSAGLRFPLGGLEHGLVDFPTTWDGRWVLLCWKRGEPELQAWHELDGGFAGRRPITAEQAERMGAEEVAEPLDGEEGVEP